MRIVMKFGGTLLDSEDKLRNVINVISSYYSEGNNIVVIISALNGITDKILDLCKDIKKINKNIINNFVSNIETIHTNLIEKVITNSERKTEILAIIANLLKEFKEILVGISILGEITPKSRDYLVSFGERLSILMSSSKRFLRRS